MGGWQGVEWNGRGLLAAVRWSTPALTEEQVAQAQRATHF